MTEPPPSEMTARRTTISRRGRAALIVAGMTLGFVLSLVLGLVALAPPALAHGGDETQEGYLLVQQALGHLAHDTTHTGIDLAMEKVDDALAAKDQDGVAVAEVKQAKAALEAMRVEQARTLLQDSIKVALRELPAATGNETGTTAVVPELPGRDGLTGLDWLLLGARSSLWLLVCGCRSCSGPVIRSRYSAASWEARRAARGGRARAGQGRREPVMATTAQHQAAPRSPGRFRRAVDVIDDRLGISALEYPVPEHANGLAWSLGGVTACAFVLLVATGVLLVQFYAPVPEAANQSVRDMVTDVWGMRFVRALHFWSAQAMYITATLHLLRVFFTARTRSLVRATGSSESRCSASCSWPCSPEPC